MILETPRREGAGELPHTTNIREELPLQLSEEVSQIYPELSKIVSYLRELDPERLLRIQEFLKKFWEKIETELKEVLPKLNLPRLAELSPILLALVASGCIPQGIVAPIEEFLNIINHPTTDFLLGALLLLYGLGFIIEIFNIIGFRPTLLTSIRRSLSSILIFRGGRRRGVSVGRRGILSRMSEFLGERRLLNYIFHILLIISIFSSKEEFTKALISLLNWPWQATSAVSEQTQKIFERVTRVAEPLVGVVEVRVEDVLIKLENQKNIDKLKQMVNEISGGNIEYFETVILTKQILSVGKITDLKRDLRDLGAFQGMGDFSPYLIFTSHEGKNPYFYYLYRDLSGVIEEIKKPGVTPERLKRLERLRKIRDAAYKLHKISEGVLRYYGNIIDPEMYQLIIDISTLYNRIYSDASSYLEGPLPQK